MEEDRQKEIRQKGFDMSNTRISYEGPLDYNSIKIGTKVLEDASLDLGSIPKVNRNYGNKLFILRAIQERNLPLMREISNYFYNTNGIYSRICDYFAYMFRYDWYIVPEIEDDSIDEKKVMKAFNNILSYLDNSNIKKTCGDIALKVVKDGAYYACIMPSTKGVVLQELPINYCRCRFNTTGNVPALIEFDLRFFDENFSNIEYRTKILKMFPKDIQRGYILYKQGKLKNDNLSTGINDDIWSRGRRAWTSCSRSGCWFPLEPGTAIKFSLGSNEQPFFMNAIPSLLDLDAAQDIDRRKQMQQLQSIVIQKLPLDKNGDLIFDVDEARDIHNNGVDMLQHAVGTDLFTTFADVKVEDLGNDSTSTSSSDTLTRMERQVYNNFGSSRNLFNSDTNLALSMSILDDESTMRQLVYQFTSFFDKIIKDLDKNKKKYSFRFYMLETTQYNYKELAKTYKEQVQIGYSKMLPQIALGHSQSSIIHTAYFENNVMSLSELMIPPMMSSTMNAESLKTLKEGKGSEESAGRPEKPDSEKSDKTIANKESM